MNLPVLITYISDIKLSQHPLKLFVILGELAGTLTTFRES